MTDQLLPPANWYADPEGSGRLRYWDGSAWTGVYLNRTERGPSLWSQYWDRVRWYVFGLLLIAIPVAGALDPPSLGMGIVFAHFAMQRRDEDPPLSAPIALAASASLGVALWAGWLPGLGIAACAAALIALARFKDRLSEQIWWFSVAFVGFGILAIIADAADLWRG